MSNLDQSPIIAGILCTVQWSGDTSEWERFRPGIEIRRLYTSGEQGPAAALLRYQRGARLPLHEHLGYEHVLVLDGAQTDENGCYPAGTLVINRPGTRHRVYSETGCVVLIIWEKGVRFLEVV